MFVYLPQLAALMEEKKRAYDDGHALARSDQQADPSLYFEKAADLDFQVQFCCFVAHALGR